MNCRDVRDLLPQHVAGELEDAEFETHLALCAACARHEELSRMVWDLSGLVPDEPVPDASIQQLYDSIERVRRRPQRMLVSLLRLGTVAAAAVLLAAGAWWTSRERTSVPTEEPRLMDGTDFAAYLEPAVGTLEVRGGSESRPLGLRSHRVTVALSDWVLRTEVEEIFVNRTGRRLEGTFYFPLPPDASLSRFAMEVNGTLVEGELVERVRAREVYEGIVRRMKDPALLEWMPGNIFKARIFPIEPYSEKRVILAYTQAPRMWNGALTYVYPLASEKTQKHPPDEIEIRASYAFGRPVRRVESPTHLADVTKRDARSGQVRLRLRKRPPTDHFRIDLELEPEELAAAAHRPAGQDGYLAAAFAPRFERAASPAGTYVFVVDRSARMSETDLAIARRTVLAMIGELGPTDRVGIVAHHVEPWIREPSFVTPARQEEWAAFLGDLRGEGASDVLGALKAASGAAPEGATVLYVGKGVPTYGVTEGGILAQEAAAALRGRTFRAVVVGREGNADGLALLAGVRDGDVRSIAPGGDTEEQIAAIARTVAIRPVLGIELDVRGVELRDVATTSRGAVYPGERIFLFARYAADEAPRDVTVTVRGTWGGRPLARSHTISLPSEPGNHGGIMRLWAQGVLADRVAACQRAGVPDEARRGIVEMSRAYQVMTPYTSFLVLESEEAYKKHQIERAKRLEGVRRPDPKPEGEDKEARVRESQRLYEVSLAHHDKGEFEKAKEAAEAAVKAWGENLAARKLHDDLSQLTLGGQPEYGVRSMAEDELRGFRVKIEQAQIEITKHVRDGERYYNARMYEEAMREFENAEFKIRAIPYDVRAMNDLLPRVQDYTFKTRNARILDVRRVEGEKRRMAEAEAGGEWDRLLRGLKQDYAVSGQQKEVQADEHYRLAERYFHAGDFEKSEIETQKAVALDPGHAPARALHLETEFILGRHKVTPGRQEYDRYMKESLVRHQQVLVEVDQSMARGTRFYNRGEFEKAKREYRQVLEYAKWMPTGVEFDTRAREARQMLMRTRGASLQSALDEEQARLRRIEAVPAASTPGDQERAFEQALTSFEQGRYGQCIELCDALLAIDPSLRSVAEMRETAQKTRHKEELRSARSGRLDAWRRAFQRQVAGEFGDNEMWRKLIATRKSKGISELEEDVPLEDREIHDKLKSIRITIDMEDAPLTAFVDYIREISGLNLHIDTREIENPDEEVFSFKVSDIVLDGALRLMLGVREMGYRIDGGVVVITSQRALGTDVRLKLYDVQDLVLELQDFPGVDVSLARTRFPSRTEWGEISKRVVESTIRTEGGPGPEEDPEILAITRKLDTMKIDLKFEKTTLEDILAFIRDFSGLNIILDADVRDEIDPDERITFRVKDMVLGKVLTRLLTRFGLRYVVTEEKVVLITRRDPGPWEITGEELAALIEQAFSEGEWRISDGKSIQYQNGLLIVRNSGRVHEGIRGILREIRLAGLRSRMRARADIEDGLRSIRNRFRGIRK